MAVMPDHVAKLIALEPSGFTLPPSRCPPVYIVTGDYLGCDEIWHKLASSWADLVRADPAIHTLSLAVDFPGTSQNDDDGPRK